jgi:hypothetical protein
MILNILLTKVGVQIFFISFQIAIPKILGLILLSQIRKFLRGVPVSLQIADQQKKLFNPQVANT